MAKLSIRNILVVLLIFAVAVLALVITFCLKSDRLWEDVFLVADEHTGRIINQDPASLTGELLQRAAQTRDFLEITVDYPFDKSVFPPEIVAPTFLWHDESEQADLWLIDIAFEGSPKHVYVISAGVQSEPYIDPEAVSPTNAHYKRSEYDLAAKAFMPDEVTWNKIKRNCVEKPATLTIYGFSSGKGSSIFSKGSIEFITSSEPVGAPVFYRDVPLMPSETSKGVIKPIAKNALPLISWRLRDISKPAGPVVLKDMPTCANCHTFSKDGKVLGMDMDGPGGDKGAYGITRVQKEAVITYDDIITWNSYEFTPEGHKNFGLFSQVSPDGRYVISTLNEATFVVNYQQFEFLQSFYPTRGILVYYDRQTGQMKALPGADNPEYVHANACWSPDGKRLVFSRAKAKNKYEHDELPTEVGDRRETFIQYDLYEIGFNDGKGGKPIAIKGASQNGMSNSFPRYSPNGKWIVFVQASKGQLMRPDSKLYLIPASGGVARQMNCNLEVMNSWHSFSPNGKWMVFASKGFTPFTQMFLTHIDENGNDSPAILIPNSTAANRAVNIPEFLNNSTDAIQSISTPTQESYRHYGNATDLAKAGKLPEALLEVEKSLQLHPFYAKAHHDKGFILFKMGRDLEAIECFKKAIELEPEDGKAYNSLGFVLESQGNVKEAVEYYNRALEIDPYLTNALCNLGNIYRLEGRLDEAAESYRKALEVKPYLGEAHSNLGVVLQAQGKAEEALASYKKALEAEPEYVPAHYNIGLLLQSQGKLDEAVVSFQKALELESSYTPARYSLASLLQSKGKIEEAAKEYLILLEQEPGHVESHYNLGLCLAMSNKFPQALECFRRVIQLNPQHAEAYYNIGGIFYGAGNLPDAAEYLGKAVQTRPDYVDARAALADVLTKQKKIKEAVEQYDKILELEPADISVMNTLAWVLATAEDEQIRDADRAVELAERAGELTDYKQPAVMDTLAAAYVVAGEFEKAIKTAEKAMELALTGGEEELAERIKKRIELYKQGQSERN
jgi:tetratricopeptide (TPR) repeat protein